MYVNYINIAHQELRSPREARGTLHEYCKQINVRVTFATFFFLEGHLLRGQMHSEPAWAGGPVLVRSEPTTGKRGAAAMGRAMRGLVVRARRGLLLRGKGGFSLCLATRGRPASSQERAWRRSRWARSCRRGSPAVPPGGIFPPRKVPVREFLPHQLSAVGARHLRWTRRLPGAIFSSMRLFFVLGRGASGSLRCRFFGRVV